MCTYRVLSYRYMYMILIEDRSQVKALQWRSVRNTFGSFREPLTMLTSQPLYVQKTISLKGGLSLKIKTTTLLFIYTS